MAADRETLEALNLEIGNAEGRGDKGFFEDLLAPSFAFRRANGVVVDRKQYIEAVGGKLHGFWYAFGGDDAYTLWEAPDNVSMAAAALAISAGGALSSFETTVLLTVEETLAAM